MLLGSHGEGSERGEGHSRGLPQDAIGPSARVERFEPARAAREALYTELWIAIGAAISGIRMASIGLSAAGRPIREPLASGGRRH